MGAWGALDLQELPLPFPLLPPLPSLRRQVFSHSSALNFFFRRFKTSVRMAHHELELPTLSSEGRGSSHSISATDEKNGVETLDEKHDIHVNEVQRVRNLVFTLTLVSSPLITRHG